MTSFTRQSFKISSLAYVVLRTTIYETSDSENDVDEFANLEFGECVIILDERISKTTSTEDYYQVFVLSSVGPGWIDSAETYLVDDLLLI